jgi:hypothetical protein
MLCLLAAAGAASDVTDIERAAISYRRSMDRMSVQWTQTQFDYSNGVRTEFASSVTRLWRDGNRLRIDVRRTFPRGQPPYREIVGRNCGKENTIVYWLQKGETRTTLDFQPLSDAPFHTSKMIDPRMLGLFPTWSETYSYDGKHLESFLGRPDRENVKLEHAKWQEHECWLLRYHLLQGTGVDARAWIVPDWGPSVARLESEWRTPTRHFVDRVECSYQRHAASGIWYPKTCVYQRFRDEKPFKEEQLVVEALAINQIVPSNAFDISGLELPPKTVITGHPDYRKGSFSWDGNAVVRNHAEALRPPGSGSPGAGRSSNWRSLLMLNAIILSGIAAFFVWRWQRSCGR